VARRRDDTIGYARRGRCAARLVEVGLLRVVVSLLIVALATACAASRASAADGDYAKRSDVRAFVDELVRDDGFRRAPLMRALRDARFQPKIVEAMSRPLLEPPKWFEYSPQLLAGPRIDAGVEYWNAHADALARAESAFGVPGEIVVAIIGVETYYGRYTGRYRAIDALATLAFDYPRRAPFFRGELRQFLLLAREQGFSPLAPKGSFAGALGVPQFMPGSYRNYAIDFDADGRVDLWSDADDVIGSVAHFLARHDWHAGQPVLLPMSIDSQSRDLLLRRLDGGLSERRALDAWAADGVAALDAPGDLADDPVGVLLLEEDAAERIALRIACHNFYVITRYNRSRLYAAAVHELAKAIRTARDASATTTLAR
jgi:membrane-bound lytic murein transglycosylase B